MPIYLGTDRIGTAFKGSNTIGRAFLQYKNVFGPGEDRNYEFANHYYYATDAKDALTTQWTDTGATGGATIPYIGTQTTYVTLNAASGSYISTTNDAAYYDASAITATTDFSFRFWVRSNNDTTGGARYFLQYGSAASDTIVDIRQVNIGSNEYISLVVDTMTNISATFPNNVWAMFTVVYEGATKEFSLYKNNSLIGTETVTDPSPQYGPELRLLDKDALVATDPWNADTKLFAWYNSKLTLAQITELYNQDLANKF